MKRFGFYGLFFVLIVVGAFLIAGCAGQQNKPAGESNVIKIGFAAPLSGSQAEMGTYLKNGALMAIDKINAKGGINGKKLELVAMDDKADPKEAVSVAQKFAADPSIVAVIGHLNSGASIPASAIYHQAGLVMVSPSSTNPKLTEQGFNNVFRVCTTDAMQGPFAAKFVKDKLKKDTAVVLDDKTAYGQGLADEFAKAFQADGGKVLMREGINQGDKDFTALLTKIKSVNPQVIYFGGMYPEAGQMVKQMKSLGMNKIDFVSGDGVEDPAFIKIAGADANGTYASNVGPAIEKVPGSKEFIDEYTKKFGNPPGPYALFGYDAALAVITALEKAPKPDRADVLKVMPTVSFEGMLGKTSFDSKGDTTNKILTMFVVKDEKWQPVD
ncbi:branched-chain amino acid ABC transporter substrate-binding protein [Thermodesulfobium sp.]